MMRATAEVEQERETTREAQRAQRASEKAAAREAARTAAAAARAAARAAAGGGESGCRPRIGGGDHSAGTPGAAGTKADGNGDAKPARRMPDPGCFPCADCSKVFTLEWTLGRHRRREHSDAPDVVAAAVAKAEKADRRRATAAARAADPASTPSIVVKAEGIGPAGPAAAAPTEGASPVGVPSRSPAGPVVPSPPPVPRGLPLLEIPLEGRVPPSLPAAGVGSPSTFVARVASSAAAAAGRILGAVVGGAASPAAGGPPPPPMLE